MKKCFLILLISFVSLISLAQQADTSYYSLQVKEQVHHQDFTLDSCFVKIQSISVPEVAELKATVFLKIYKFRSYAIENPSWTISPQEIPVIMYLPIGPLFSEGNLFIKITAGIKEYLLSINPSWNSNNLIITK